MNQLPEVFLYASVARGLGAGKTTIASLLQRLYDPQEGAIRIDGMDLRSIRRDSLRD